MLRIERTETRVRLRKKSFAGLKHSVRALKCGTWLTLTARNGCATGFSAAGRVPGLPDRCCSKIALSQGLKYHYRLVRSRHHSFSDGDQLVLLIEDPEARRPKLAGIKFRR